MGLDMYLEKRTYVKNWKHMEAKERHTICVLKGEKVREDIKTERISYIIEEVCRWRKANAIHGWFVRTVQKGEDDCGSYHVNVDKLKELKAACDKVLDDKSLAKEILPTMEGFFFGGTDYNEYYVEELQHTSEAIAALLAEPGIEIADLYYHSSW